MPSAVNIQARKAARIKASTHTLTLVYPPAYVDAVVTPTPGAVPVSPLTGPIAANTLVPPAAATPTSPSVTVSCLWYDAPTAPTLATGQDARLFGKIGWRDGAHALAEVLVTDIAVDPTAPYGKTRLDGVLHLVHGGRTYQLLEFRPAAGAAFALPSTYFVWLMSAAHQEP